MKLNVKSGSAAGTDFEIDREVTAGRAHTADIVIADAGISSRHARLRPVSDGVEVTDLESTNGTFVDGQKIVAPTVVRPGQALRFSTTELQVLAPALQASKAATARYGTARLIVRSGADRSKELVLSEGHDYIIGRAADASLRLNDPRVSERNTRIRLNGNVVQVTDLGSSNGTTVDGRAVVGTVNAPEGCEIQVGESVVTFTRQEGTESALTPMPTILGRKSDISDSTIDRRVKAAVAASEKQTAGRMRLMMSGVGVLAMGAVAIGAWALLRDTGDGEMTAAEVVKAVKPSVVRVELENSAGSGSIIDLKNGYVLTNNHVIATGKAKVRNDEIGDPVETELLGTAYCDDLALLRIEEIEDLKGLKEMKFGDIKKVEQGQRVVALGYPGSAEAFEATQLSATGGLVSKVKTVYERAVSYPRHTNVVQTDAPINSGNSGGPLVTLKGEQIGVNTYSAAGLKDGQGYSISVERVNQVLPDLIAGRSPKWIGIRPDVIYDDKTGEPLAMVIESIYPGSSAQKAGVKLSDIILSIDGQDVRTAHDYCDVMPDDGNVTLTLLDLNTGKTREVDVEVGET